MERDKGIETEILAEWDNESIYERFQRIRFADISHKQSRSFRVVKQPRPDTWYDFRDGPTGKHGQCKMNQDGTWHQRPTGERPVILKYLGEGKKDKST